MVKSVVVKEAGGRVSVSDVEMDEARHKTPYNLWVDFLGYTSTNGIGGVLRWEVTIGRNDHSYLILPTFDILSALSVSLKLISSLSKAYPQQHL